MSVLAFIRSPILGSMSRNSKVKRTLVGAIPRWVTPLESLTKPYTVGRVVVKLGTILVGKRPGCPVGGARLRAQLWGVIGGIRAYTQPEVCQPDIGPLRSVDCDDLSGRAYMTGHSAIDTSMSMEVVMLMPKKDDEPSRPKVGETVFHTAFFKYGLCFPLLSIFEMLHKYGLVSEQLTPNLWRSLATMTMEGIKKKLGEMKRVGQKRKGETVDKKVLKKILSLAIINDMEVIPSNVQASLLTTLGEKDSLSRFEVRIKLNVCLSPIEHKYPDLDLSWVYKVDTMKADA
ncbi:hypothetical protein FNV43_RR02370 [Rhamnella rubrinervis]|uniref:Uncharacterized protein n=1 Tax=Rhamnella rubrinervis TaxID=2594499 RepID=A0A8K0HRC3_9ROSA|nr:hypothetical protein FNV43_RR02370 [Rhamnella rubrinervis]